MINESFTEQSSMKVPMCLSLKVSNVYLCGCIYLKLVYKYLKLVYKTLPCLKSLSAITDVVYDYKGFFFTTWKFNNSVIELVRSSQSEALAIKIPIYAVEFQ